MVITAKCPFCKADFTDEDFKEPNEPLNVFTTPPTKQESIYYKDGQKWKPGHEHNIFVWNQTLGITPLPKKKYLFSWDNIPESDSGRLIDFLKQNFGIDWVKTAKIDKFDNGKAIRVSDNINSLSLSLNDEKNKVNLKIDDGRVDELIAKMENDKLNIYKKNIRYWTRAIKCKKCNQAYDAYLFEKGNNPKEIWPFLFGDSYPKRLPIFSRFVDSQDGVFWAIIAGIIWGLISTISVLLSSGTEYIIHDIVRWAFLLIFSIMIGAIVHHLITAKKIRKKWKDYIKNLSYYGIDNDSWNFWCNFTEARFEGSCHKITQPLGAGLLSFILFFVPWLFLQDTSYGIILNELLFYGSMAFVVGIAFWVSIDATTIVIRTFSQFPLKINIFEPYSSVSEVSALALTSTLNLTLILMIPTSISILSFYGLTSPHIQWILLWINILIIVIFIWIAYSFPNLWLRCATILTLFIYLLSFYLQTTLFDLMPSIPIASIVSSFALSILILITFVIAIYPLYNVIKKYRLNKINQINIQLNDFLDSATEQKKLKSPIELNDLIQIRDILYSTSNFPVSTNLLYRILLLSELPVVSNILSYLLHSIIKT